MINTPVKQFIFDRLMIATVEGVYTKDIAIGMRNCRMSFIDNTKAIVISDYQGVSYLLAVRLMATSLGMTVELIDSDKDYQTMLEKYMTMDNIAA